MSQLPTLPYQISETVVNKAKKIKLALFDVDGVLTDGKLHYGPQGEQTKVFHAHDGHGLKMLDKRQVFVDLLAELNLTGDDCSFAGDDVIDLPVMNECGLKFSVENGHFIVKDIADWVAPLPGGNGAVRAICDVLLYSQDNYPLGIGPQQ